MFSLLRLIAMVISTLSCYLLLRARSGLCYVQGNVSVKLYDHLTKAHVFHFCTDYFVVLDGSNDIVSEAIYFFKANVFFKSYEIKVSF